VVHPDAPFASCWTRYRKALQATIVTARTGTLPNSIYFIVSEADFRVVFRDKIHIFCRPRRGLLTTPSSSWI
jgi:hypothetical protein